MAAFIVMVRLLNTLFEMEILMSEVRIYLPAQNAMQSGLRGNCSKWTIEFIPSAPSSADPLMGWIGSSDTQKQVRLKFDSKEEAVAYAKSKGLSYEIQEPKPRKFHIKNYANNFAFSRRF